MRPQVGILITPETLLYGQDGHDPRTRADTRFGDGAPPDITYLFDHDTDVGDGDDYGEVVADDGADGAAPPFDESADHTDRVDGADHADGERPDADDQRPDQGAPANARGDPLAALGIRPPVEPAWLNWYGPVAPETAQRVFCDSDVWRVVLDPASGLPLDVGRAYRLVPYWIRRALYARDRGCRWPGCTAPAAWCDGHHLKHWHDGGTTRVEDLLLACRYHHVLLHEGRWTIHLDPTTGKVTVTRPDGTPHDIGPSTPWTTPTTRNDDPPDTS
jgi:hypothetical protein